MRCSGSGEEALVGLIPNGMRLIGLASQTAVTSVSAGQEPFWWAWLDLNQRPHPYQGSAPGLFPRIAPTSCANDVPLETATNRSGSDGMWTKCGPGRVLRGPSRVIGARPHRSPQ
jgi:hypothetical protein